MVVEVILGATFGSLFSGILSYYIGYHKGMKKSKKYILLPSTNRNIGRKWKKMDSSNTL